MVPPLSRRAILRLAGAFSGGLIAGATGLIRFAPNRIGAESFTLNGFTVDEPFASYWRQNGGLAQQGLPISPRFGEVSSVNGQMYQVQYFERAIFELHPEYAGTENEVLLQLAGRDAYLARYPEGAPQQEANAIPGSVLFPETGKRLGGRFLQYWQQHGGLRQQGFPISDEFTEISAIDGKPYRVQYFERAVFEHHPENQAPYDVLLSLLGNITLKDRYPNGVPAPQPSPEPGCTPLGVPRTDSRKTGIHYFDGEAVNPEGVGNGVIQMYTNDRDYGGKPFMVTRIVSIDELVNSVIVDTGKAHVRVQLPAIIDPGVDRKKYRMEDVHVIKGQPSDSSYHYGWTLCGDLEPGDVMYVVVAVSSQELAEYRDQGVDLEAFGTNIIQ